MMTLHLAKEPGGLVQLAKLLALDQASQVSGYSVFEKETGKLIAHGSFSFTQPDFDTRLYHINRKVKQLIEEYNIEEVYLEDIQLQGEDGIPNVLVYKRLAEVLGVLCCLCAELQLPHTVVPPATWRHTCGIRGKTRQDKKNNAQLYVRHKYHISVTDAVADAICIGEHAIASINPNDWSN